MIDPNISVENTITSIKNALKAERDGAELHRRWAKMAKGKNDPLKSLLKLIGAI